jgi:hypothetical protein
MTNDKIKDDPTMTDESKLEALRAALIAGEQSGIAEGDVFARIREHIRKRYGSPSDSELTSSADQLFHELVRREQQT